jgi:DNA-binding MarR family transcriptional regulator
LEEAKLAVRKHGKAGDRRFTRVILTEEGQLLRRQVMAAREQLIEQRLSAIPPHDLSQLSLSLQHLADTLQHQFDENEVAHLIDMAAVHGKALE